MDAEDNNARSKSLNRRDRGEVPPSSLRQTGDLQIRLAAPQDSDAVSSILLAAFLEYRPLYTDGGFAATALDPQQIRARMREGPVWIASRGGENLGTVAAVRKADAVYVRGMAVLPAARGSGAGSQLLKSVERWAADEGVRRLFLSTTPFLHDAIRLYERSGFVRIDEDPQNLFDTPLFTMAKLLSRSE